VFDGTNDYVQVTSPFGDIDWSSRSWTISAWMKLDVMGDRCLVNLNSANSSHYVVTNVFSGGKSYWYFIKNSTPTQTNFSQSISNFTTNEIFHFTMTYNGNGLSSGNISFYKNGILLDTTGGGSAGLSNQSGLQIGGNYFLDGNVYNFLMWNRAITSSEVLQNYYGAPISTDSLAFAIDAGNLASYSGTGITLKGLSPSGYTATLTNGPTYSSSNGGTIVLDGVDDIITSSLTRVGYSNTTQIVWYKWDGVNKIASIMYLGDGGSTGYGFIVHDGSSSGVGNKVGILYGGAYYNAINVGTTYATLVSGVWTQLAVTRDSTTTYLYQNGNLLGYTTRNPNGSASTLSLGVSSVVGGSIGPALFYNRALSADEIGQNFNCYKSRFGL